MNFLENQENKEQVAIEITSLIDVMFMLVLFFLLTTTFDTASGFNVKLPKSSSTEIVRDKQDLTIVIDKDNLYTINEKKVTESELIEQFHEQAKLNPETLVIIHADTDVSHGKVVQVMDFAKQAGLSRLAIATELNQISHP